jgi:hypothetical protein
MGNTGKDGGCGRNLCHISTLTGAIGYKGPKIAKALPLKIEVKGIRLRLKRMASSTHMC